MKFIGDRNELYKTILNIIRDSKAFLYIVSPYMSFEKDYTSIKALRYAINDAMKRHVEICIITRGMDPSAPRNNIIKLKISYHIQDISI